MDIIILAGGSGSRMKSSLPKPFQQIAGKTFLHHLLATSLSLKANQIFIIQPKKNNLKKIFLSQRDKLEIENESQLDKLIWLNQENPRGTADALKTGLNYFQSETVLVLYADVPLISSETIRRLINKHYEEQASISLITQNLDDPHGYGRIIRNERNEIIQICEEKDANEKTKAIQEINTGLMIINTQVLKKYLKEIKSNSAQKEYYLTDLIAIAENNHLKIASIQPLLNFEVQGVNDKTQLQSLERKVQLFLAH